MSGKGEGGKLREAIRVRLSYEGTGLWSGKTGTGITGFPAV